MRLIYLSHVLSPRTPVYADNPALVARHDRQISRGDTANTQFYEMHSHTGTHVDAPLHFGDDGASVDRFAAHEWVFEPVELLRIVVEPAQLIGVSDLEPHRGQLTNAELILVRTGFERFRGEPLYREMNPGLRPEAAEWFRTAAPKLRAVGIDCISISSYRHREIGRDAHRRFLNPRYGQPILLIEDMALRELQGPPIRVWAFPLRVEGGDGAPCTVVAEV